MKLVAQPKFPAKKCGRRKRVEGEEAVEGEWRTRGPASPPHRETAGMAWLLLDRSRLLWATTLKRFFRKRSCTAEVRVSPLLPD